MSLKELSRKFILELSTAFDYLKSSKYILEYLNNSNMADLELDLQTGLNQYKMQILLLSVKTTGLKNSDFKFLEKITIFKLLNLNVFKSESKKTKMSIVKHLANIVVLLPQLPETDIQNSGLPNLLGGNEQLNALAEKVMSQIQHDNINPMNLLGSLMSGNIEDTNLVSLLDTIKEDVSKIDKTELTKMVGNLQNVLNGAIKKVN